MVVASVWASLAFVEASLMALEEEVVVVPLLQEEFQVHPRLVVAEEEKVSASASLAFLGVMEVVVLQAEAAPHQVSPREREFPAHLAMVSAAALASLVIWVSVPRAVPPPPPQVAVDLLALQAETQSGPLPLVAPLLQAYPQGENRNFPLVLESASVWTFWALKEMVVVVDPPQEVPQCSPLASPQLVEFPVFPPLQAVLESALVWAFSVWKISAEVFPPQAAVHQPVVAHRYSTLVPSAHQPLVPPLRQAVSLQWKCPPPEVAPPQLGLTSEASVVSYSLVAAAHRASPRVTPQKAVGLQLVWALVLASV